MLKKLIIMHGSCMRGFSEDRSSFRSLSGEQSKVRTGLLKSRACVIGGPSEQLDHEQRSGQGLVIDRNHQSSSPMSSESLKLLSLAKQGMFVIGGAYHEQGDDLHLSSSA